MLISNSRYTFINTDSNKYASTDIIRTTFALVKSYFVFVLDYLNGFAGVYFSPCGFWLLHNCGGLLTGKVLNKCKNRNKGILCSENKLPTKNYSKKLKWQ